MSDVIAARPAAENLYLQEDDVQETAPQLRRLIFLIAMGLFITSIGQPKVIGRLPITFLLKNELHQDAFQVAAFFNVATIAWYCKPFAGLLCDAFPIFGTRRRYYLVLSTLLAGLFWVAFGLVPHSYAIFFWILLLLNVAMVFASVVIGGLLVETGQKYSATGRLSSMRNGLEGIMALIAGPIGGFLATKAFGLTAGVGAFMLFSLVPVALLYLKEKPTAQRNTAVWSNTAEQLKNIFASRTMWAATILLFLFFFSPGFSTPLTFYQQDVLKLSPQTIGFIEAFGGAGGLIGAALYGVFCRRVSLRPMLFAGIVLNVIGTLFYFFYNSYQSAILITFAAGLVGTIGVLPIFDLAARATPKGSESFGFALMMSVRNLTLFLISDTLGSYIYTNYHLTFKNLVLLNAGTTLLVLLAVPFLPRILVSHRDGERFHGFDPSAAPGGLPVGE